MAPPDRVRARFGTSDCLPVYGRLTSSAGFERVLRGGTRYRCGGVTVFGMLGSHHRPRVGLVVGRRVGKAVVRNRVKRRIRTALQEIVLPDGLDYVVIGSAAVARVSFRTLCGWLQEAICVVSGREGR